MHYFSTLVEFFKSHTSIRDWLQSMYAEYQGYEYMMYDRS